MIPDIKDVYKPQGFLEFQPLLPKKDIEKNMKQLMLICQKFKSESLLAGIKVHSADNNFLSFSGDGYSIGIVIQLKGREKQNIQSFYKEIISFILDCKGKIYLAKDEMLDKYSFQQMYPEFTDLINIKNKYDSQSVFSSDLFKRLF